MNLCVLAPISPTLFLPLHFIPVFLPVSLLLWLLSKLFFLLPRDNTETQTTSRRKRDFFGFWFQRGDRVHYGRTAMAGGQKLEEVEVTEELLKETGAELPNLQACSFMMGLLLARLHLLKVPGPSQTLMAKDANTWSCGYQLTFKPWQHVFDVWPIWDSSGMSVLASGWVPARTWVTYQRANCWVKKLPSLV